MDATRFDRLVRELATLGSRRRALRILTSLPLVGSIAALGIGDRAAADVHDEWRDTEPRRHRHKRHRPKRRLRRNRRQDQQQRRKPATDDCVDESRATTCEGQCGVVGNNCGRSVDCGPCACDPPCDTCETCTSALACQACDPCCDALCCADADAICHLETGACCLPESAAETCAGQCGPVSNNCGQEVDCGSCACDPPCSICLTCDETTTTCIPNAEEVGDECGDRQVCDSDGNCACNATSCGDCRTCQADGTCSIDTDGTACDGGLCCGGACQACCERADCPVPTCQACDDDACVVDEAALGVACGDEGEVCQANGACGCTCANAVLSGGPDANDAITVDDDLDVELNGVNVFHDDDDFCQGCTPRPPDPQFNPWPPIALGCINAGDVIHVVASDSAVDRGGDNFIELSPLYLHCLTTGAVQALSADGVPRTPEPNRGQGLVFFDQEFTVTLELTRRRRKRKHRRRRRKKHR